MPITTKALQKTGPDQPFRVTTIERRDPRPDDVVIDIEAAGICHTDLAARDGVLPIDHRLRKDRTCLASSPSSSVDWTQPVSASAAMAVPAKRARKRSCAAMGVSAFRGSGRRAPEASSRMRDLPDEAPL